MSVQFRPVVISLVGRSGDGQIIIRGQKIIQSQTALETALCHMIKYKYQTCIIKRWNIHSDALTSMVKGLLILIQLIFTSLLNFSPFPPSCICGGFPNDCHLSLKFQIILPFSGTLSGTAIEHGNIDKMGPGCLCDCNDE